MKSDIHPKYGPTVIQCACGNVIETRTTAQGGRIQVEICSACHPFFTGKQRFVDTAGRIDRFKKKFGEVKGTAAPKRKKAVAPPAPAPSAAAGKVLKEELASAKGKAAKNK